MPAQRPVLKVDPATGNVQAFAIIAALFIVQAWVQFNAPLIHDASWYLHVARGLMRGKHLYTDFIEVNPPLGMWLMVPVVWLADLIHVRADWVYKAILLVISAASMGLVNRYVKLGQLLSGSERLIFVAAFALAILFLPGADFGEREHLIVLLFAPWVFLRLARHKGATVTIRESILVGIVAAVAIVLKPQSVFAPVFIEVFLLWRSRKLMSVFAPENLAAGLTVLLYAGVIYFNTPEFLTVMLPLGKAAYMPFYGYPVIVQLFNARWCLLFILATAFAVKRLLPEAQFTAFALLCAALGFALSYGVQNKGFTYQIMPATIFAWSALAVVASGLCGERTKHLAQLLAIVGLAALRIGMEPLHYTSSALPFESGLKAFAPQAKSIFIASTRLSHGFPLAEDRHLQWTSRLPTQWLAPYVAQRWHAGPLPDDKIITMALEVTVTDLITDKPDIIFIDEDQDQAYVPGGRFDYVTFWSNDPRFAPFWQGYEKRGMQDNFAVYTRK
jgi:hypothetical protein